MNRYDPSNYGIVSSGDTEADQREIRDHIRSRALMDEGLCPNGCGPRVAGMGNVDDEVIFGKGGSHCPSCGFVCNTNVIE